MTNVNATALRLTRSAWWGALACAGAFLPLALMVACSVEPQGQDSGASELEVVAPTESATHTSGAAIGDIGDMDAPAAEHVEVRSTDAGAQSRPVEQQETDEPKRDIVVVADGLWVDLAAREVFIHAEVCLREGWLEQLLCTPSTREHESIFVTSVRPSLVHASLMLLGLEPGSPGSWRLEGDRIVEVEPTGPDVDVEVLFRALEPGERVIEDDSRTPLGALVRGIHHHSAGEHPLLGSRWRFGGSVLDERETLPAGMPRYVADWSGSIIGLVTFGDEVLGLPVVYPDQVDVAPPEWFADPADIPEVGRAVTIILRAHSPAAVPNPEPDPVPVTVPARSDSIAE